jgi:hypothetical protein
VWAGSVSEGELLRRRKIDKYSQAAEALQLTAEQHPRALVESVQLERVTGQYLHAADVYIEMWIFFMDFIIGSIDEGVQLVETNRKGPFVRCVTAIRVLLIYSTSTS